MTISEPYSTICISLGIFRADDCATRSLGTVTRPQGFCGNGRKASLEKRAWQMGTPDRHPG